MAGWLEPNEEENYTFVNKIVGGAIPKEYQPSCDKGFKEAMNEGGLIGFPVVNIQAGINDGLAHAVDSSDMAFKLAARMAFREAYMRANPVVLEPVMKVVVEAPEEFQGNVLGNINKRRGMIIGSATNHGFSVEPRCRSRRCSLSNESACTQGKGRPRWSSQVRPPATCRRAIKEYREKRRTAKARALRQSGRVVSTRPLVVLRS